ncbi:MAG: DUF2461 family protein [bacterium]
MRVYRDTPFSHDKTRTRPTWAFSFGMWSARTSRAPGLYHLHTANPGPARTTASSSAPARH